ncbi:MAG: hypothetical protein HC833_06800 [Leptolyngbyaceae cyanobacterium RM1_406_9]|nr:hypothetical protein [Leptolyngbyaceae cyanobacterium RM1_406_9]
MKRSGQTDQAELLLKGHTERSFAIAFSSDDQILVNGSQNQTIRLWKVSLGQPVHLFQGYTQTVSALAFLRAIAF